jgi:lactoylglutathione lyase
MKDILFIMSSFLCATNNITYKNVRGDLFTHTGDVSEVVLQTERKEMNVDFKVDSVDEALKEITKSGGTVHYGPFDIPIGKCAVVSDKWNNNYVILDMSKGRYVTDEKKNVIGVEKIDE